MRNAVQLCLAANNILHMREGNRTFLGYRSCVKMADHFASRGLKLGYSKTQERIKRDREGILRTHPIPQVIRLELFLRPQIPRGDWTTANHIAQMCSAWMTHAQSYASFTN